MAIEWFYAHDGHKLGPFSGLQMKEFAARGEVMPTDTVWKAGVDAGVEASRIKNLFATPNADSSPPPADVAVAEPPIPPPLETSNPELIPLEAPQRNKNETPSEKPKPTRRPTASAKGADIVGVTETDVRYRMKCSDCGHKDSSTRTIRVANKTIKSGFFCPKCKKRREVAIQCRLG